MLADYCFVLHDIGEPASGLATITSSLSDLWLHPSVDGSFSFNPRINPGPDAQESVDGEYWHMMFRSANNLRKGTS